VAIYEYQQSYINYRMDNDVPILNTSLSKEQVNALIVLNELKKQLKSEGAALCEGRAEGTKHKFFGDCFRGMYICSESWMLGSITIEEVDKTETKLYRELYNFFKITAQGDLNRAVDIVDQLVHEAIKLPLSTTQKDELVVTSSFIRDVRTIVNKDKDENAQKQKYLNRKAPVKQPVLLELEEIMELDNIADQNTRIIKQLINLDVDVSKIERRVTPQHPLPSKSLRYSLHDFCSICHRPKQYGSDFCSFHKKPNAKEKAMGKMDTGKHHRDKIKTIYERLGFLTEEETSFYFSLQEDQKKDLCDCSNPLEKLREFAKNGSGNLESKPAFDSRASILEGWAKTHCLYKGFEDKLYDHCSLYFNANRHSWDTKNIQIFNTLPKLIEEFSYLRKIFKKRLPLITGTQADLLRVKEYVHYFLKLDELDLEQSNTDDSSYLSQITPQIFFYMFSRMCLFELIHVSKTKSFSSLQPHGGDLGVRNIHELNSYFLRKNSP